MAFVRKSDGSFQVRQGNNNDLLTTFSGKDAAKKAREEVARLHRKNKPKTSNRGKSAKTDFFKGNKAKTKAMKKKK